MVENIELIYTKTLEQLGILVLDGSGSMAAPGETGSPKAAEIAIATRDLISRLKNGKRKDEFLLSIIMYDQNVEERIEPKPVTAIDETADYNPIHNHGGETSIGDALEKAGEISEKFLAKATEYPRSTVIILMTDGHNTIGKNPEEIADKIKTDAKTNGKLVIHAVGFGKDSEIDKSMLERIVSGSGKLITTRNPEDIRKFFMASITAPVH